MDTALGGAALQCQTLTIPASLGGRAFGHADCDNALAGRCGNDGGLPDAKSARHACQGAELLKPQGTFCLCVAGPLPRCVVVPEPCCARLDLAFLFPPRVFGSYPLRDNPMGPRMDDGAPVNRSIGAGIMLGHHGLPRTGAMVEMEHVGSMMHEDVSSSSQTGDNCGRELTVSLARDRCVTWNRAFDMFKHMQTH